MEKIKLTATKREETGKNGQLRRDGFVPAVVYGQGKEPVHLVVSDKEFAKVNRDAGGSAIIRLAIENDGAKNVLIHDVQYDVLKDVPTHVDFLEISMREKITTTVPLAFVGDSSAVIELGGTLITNKTEVEIECLPADLPPHIEVDIAPLVDFETDIHVSGIIVPTGVEIKDEPEEMVATVEPPRSDEELAELEELPEEPAPAESEHGEAPEEVNEEKEEQE